MVRSHANHRTILLPLRGGKWSATTETLEGPITAIGDSIEEAKIALDQLLVIARALEVTRRQSDR